MIRPGMWIGLLVAVVASTSAVTDAASQSGGRAYSPGFAYRDVALTTGSDGQTQSEVFQVGSLSVRMFVRDRNVATARGPHDRVCVTSSLDRIGFSDPVPQLALSLVGARPDAGLSATLWTGDFDAVTIECALVPTASAYRMWWRGTPAGNVDWPAWTRPAVFETLEPMTDQNASGPLARNLERIINALQLDGVCAAVTVLRAPFLATEGTIGSPLWSRSISGVSSMVNASPWTRQSDSSQRHDEIMNDEGWYRARLISPGLSDSDAFVHPVQTAFLPREGLERVLNEHPLNPQLSSVAQLEYAQCHGEPIEYLVRGSGKLELYGFYHLVMVVPYLSNYSQISADLQEYWQSKNNEYMTHELIHVYDYLDGLNETVFQTKGALEYTMSPQGGSPPRFRFSRIEQALVSLASLSVNDFHHALYRQTGPDGQVTRNTDLSPAGPAYIGDFNVLRRAQEEFERWLRGQ